MNGAANYYEVSIIRTNHKGYHVYEWVDAATIEEANRVAAEVEATGTASVKVNRVVRRLPVLGLGPAAVGDRRTMSPRAWRQSLPRLVGGDW